MRRRPEGFCEECMYFHKGGGKKASNSVCRYYPPKVFILNNSIKRTYYPSTHIEGWCGKFEKIPTPVEEADKILNGTKS